MLKRLYIKNVALIKEANIEFDVGLNVLSGETGAGKSIIFDSLNFVLASKADKTMIRYGETEAFVKAEFSVDASDECISILKEYDIESDGEIIISRRLTVDGKNTVKINGNTITLSMLKAVTTHLVDIHGQSEHLFLLNESYQLKVIDDLLSARGTEIKKEIARLLGEKRQYKEKISALGGSESERERKLDLLEYQIDEIERAQLKSGELEELKARRNIILNVEKILNTVETVKMRFEADGGICDNLNSATREFSKISGISEEYNALLGRLDALDSEMTDICDALGDITDGLSFDENEAKAVDGRISLIKSLIKKYGENEDEIIAFMRRAEEERETLADGAKLLEKYEKQIRECDDSLYKLCVELSALRKNVSVEFGKAVVAELRSLNIPNAVFNVNFKEFTKDTARIQSNGCDEVYFSFSANRGEPDRPLNTVASGGEISRFMLAVKTILKNLNGISTYIFDEIDTGISGHTADAVAIKFKNIAKCTQIIAVSHLPQICAASDAQYLIRKLDEGGTACTSITKLTAEQKIDEIIRLTGNVSSDSARRHAKELINRYIN